MILTEAALSFRSGIQPPQSSWGLMLSQGRQYITTAGGWSPSRSGDPVDRALAQPAGHLGADRHRSGAALAILPEDGMAALRRIAKSSLSVSRLAGTIRNRQQNVELA